MNKNFALKWWIIVCIQVLIISLSVYFGMWTHIAQVDVTYISFIIMGVWAITTCFIGKYHFTGNREKFLPVGWFLAEVCLSLGMLGTVSGFLIMLVTSFESIDVTNTQTLQEAISSMALGMGTALYTTMIGIVTSLFIKSQLVNLESK